MTQNKADKLAKNFSDSVRKSVAGKFPITVTLDFLKLTERAIRSAYIEGVKDTNIEHATAALEVETIKDKIIGGLLNGKKITIE